MTYGIQASGNSTSITKLGVLQKRVIRIINKKRFRSHSDPIFKSESILKISDLYKLHVSLFMFDLQNGSLPISFKTYIQQSETATHNTMCTRQHGLLKKERARTTFSSKLPKHNFTNIWNNISENIRNVANRRLFKCMLHKYYTDQYESLVICTNPICPVVDQEDNNTNVFFILMNVLVHKPPTPKFKTTKNLKIQPNGNCCTICLELVTTHSRSNMNLLIPTFELLYSQTTVSRAH